MVIIYLECMWCVNLVPMSVWCRCAIVQKRLRQNGAMRLGWVDYKYNKMWHNSPKLQKEKQSSHVNIYPNGCRLVFSVSCRACVESQTFRRLVPSLLPYWRSLQRAVNRCVLECQIPPYLRRDKKGGKRVSFYSRICHACTIVWVMRFYNIHSQSKKNPGYKNEIFFHKEWIMHAVYLQSSNIYCQVSSPLLLY